MRTGSLQVPVNSLDKFLNNETVVNQDLVAWVSMGIIHVPRAEVGLSKVPIVSMPSYPDFDFITTELL